MKTNNRKVKKYVKCSKGFSLRYDLENGKYLSIFLGIFAEGGGELYETNWSHDKKEIGKEIIW